MIARAAALGLAALLVACAPRPVPADPALWEVTAPDGGKGWLFGTIHSLERPADWRGPKVDGALSAARVVMVEIADLGDAAKGKATFARLATSPGHGRLSARLGPDARPALLAVLNRNRMADGQFAQTETWAAALMIVQAETRDLDSGNGIDRAVIAAAKDKPVEGLESFAGQLGLFDSLPEREQRDLLAAIVADAEALEGTSPDLADAWLIGDMATIERETRRGLMADPELREALFICRNREWTGRIARALAAGRRPFVAVGAAHMAGPDGLPAMLAARGFKVRRIQ